MPSDRFTSPVAMGSGAMGTVSRATDRLTGLAVAIKRLHTANPVHAQALIRETEVLASLEHPGIARIVAHGVDDGRPWMATEWVDGDRLDSTWSGAGATLDLDAAGFDLDDPLPGGGVLGLTTLARLARTLGWLHGEGIVHRDLKPANVVVRAGWPILVDFGIRSRFAADGRESTDTVPLRVGTPGYMAPEQILGIESDARTDAFALGCLLYTCLTGREAFGSGRSALRTTLRGLPAPPETGLSELDGLAIALLSPEPADRPGFLDEIADVLDRHHDQTSHWPGAPPTRACLFRARHRGRIDTLERVEAKIASSSLAVLVGPTGVGRTRLLKELETPEGTQTIVGWPVEGDADRRLLALADLVREQPTRLILDDLHLDEAGTAAVSKFAARPWPGLELAASWRTDRVELPDALGTCAIEVPQLGDEEILGVIEDVLGGDDPGLGPRVVEHAGGNPLHAAEWVRTAVATGVVRRVDGSWHTDATGLAGLPDSLQELGLARLETLTSGARDVVRAAAILGDAVTPAALRAVGVDPADAMEAVAAGLLDGLVFVHDALRRAVSSAMDPRDRADLAGRAAQAVEGSASPAQIADLWVQAGSKRALPWLARAAEVAIAAGRTVEARNRLRVYRRISGPSTTPEHLRIAMLRAAVTDRTERVEAAREVLGLARQLGDADAEALAQRRLAHGLVEQGLIEEALAEAIPGAHRALMLGRAGRFDEAIEELGRTEGEPPEDVAEAAGLVYMFRGEFELAVRAFDGVDPDACSRDALSTYASCLCEVGETERSRQLLEEILVRHGDTMGAAPLIVVHSNLSVVYRSAGRDREALSHCERAVHLALRTGRYPHVPLLNLLALQTALGDLDGASRSEQQILDLDAAMSDPRLTAAIGMVRAAFARAKGDLDQARALLPASDSIDHATLRARLLIERGRLLLAEGESAADELERARALCAERGIDPDFPSMEARELKALIEAQAAFEGSP